MSAASANAINKSKTLVSGLKSASEENTMLTTSKLAKKITYIEQKSWDVPQAFIKDKLREDIDTNEEVIR